jgi:PleD family two-component response regulator
MTSENPEDFLTVLSGASAESGRCTRRKPSIGEQVVRILVVENEAKVAKALSDCLTAEGYDVRIASTGEEAVFLVSDESFGIVLLDLLLRRDGLEILGSSPGSASTPTLRSAV